MRPRPGAEDFWIVAGRVAQVDPVQAQHRQSGRVGLGQPPLTALESLMQVAAALKAVVAFQLPVVEVASDYRRGIVRQLVEKVAQQVQLQLSVAFKQAEMHTDRM